MLAEYKSSNGIWLERRALAPIAAGDSPARAMFGLQELFPPEKIRSLYMSPAEYLKRFDKEIDRMVAERWLLAKDGAVLKTEEANIPAF